MDSSFCVGPLGLQDSGYGPITVKNVTAVTQAIGRVVQLDLALVDADTTNLKFGAAGSGYNHTILPQAGFLGILSRHSIFGVVIAAAIVAAGDGKILLSGKCRALALDSGAGNAWVRGQDGVVTAAGVVDMSDAATNPIGRLVARAEQAATSAVEVLTDVWFDGLSSAIRSVTNT